MRQLSGAPISQKLGLEPYSIVAVKWKGSSFTRYADITIGGASGTLISLSGIENVTNLNNSSSVNTVSVVISDFDGSLRKIYDTVDISQKPAQVLQAFHGSPSTFVVFEGVVSSNIIWEEGEETLSFDIVSRTSLQEVGFSPEEAVFRNLDFSQIGKPWPLHFGTVRYREPLQLSTQPTGLFIDAIGVPDYGILEQVWRLNRQLMDIKAHVDDVLLPGTMSSTNPGELNTALRGKGQELQAALDQAEKERRQIQQQINDLNDTYDKQKKYFKKSGSFQSDNFPLGNQDVLINNILYQISVTATKDPTIYTFKWVKGIPPDTYTPTDQDIKEMVDKTTTSSGGANKIGFQYLNVGTAISLVSLYEYAYLVSGTNCTITDVSAYKNISGVKKLLPIPPIWRTGKLSQVQGFGFSASSYTITEEGSIPKTIPPWLDPTVLILSHSLNNLKYKHSDYGKTPGSNAPDASAATINANAETAANTWDDQIFVSTKNGIGNDVIDVMIWVINNFTSLKYDSVSFNAVKSIVHIYPVGFVLEDKKNALQFLEDLATQIRSSIWIKNGVFYISYLADEPDSVATITEDDVHEKTLKLMTTETGSIITKYTATYRLNYLPSTGQNKVILRNNIDKYGTFEESFDYFAFNIHYIVKKIATYWLLRKSNTWKRISFKTFLTKLNLEAMDCVTIDFDNTDIHCKGLIESATYDSETNTIDMTVLLPILVGNNRVSPIYWPSSLSAQSFEQQQRSMMLSGGNSGFSPVFTKATVVVPPEGGKTTINVNPEELNKTIFNTKNSNVHVPFSNLSVSDDDPSMYIGDIDQSLPIASNAQPKNFNFDPKAVPTFNYKLKDAAPSSLTDPKAGNNIYPGKVLGRGDGERMYNVLTYPQGASGDTSTVSAKQLQLDADDHLDEGTWVLVMQLKNKDKQLEYYIQAPVWS